MQKLLFVALVLFACVAASGPKSTNTYYVEGCRFDKSLKEKGEVLVILGTDWCGYCKALERDLKAAHLRVIDRVIVCDMTDPEHQADARKYASEGFPTMYLYKDGKCIRKIVGRKPVSFIEQSFTRQIVPPTPPVRQPAAAEQKIYRTVPALYYYPSYPMTAPSCPTCPSYR